MEFFWLLGVHEAKTVKSHHWLRGTTQPSVLSSNLVTDFCTTTFLFPDKNRFFRFIVNKKPLVSPSLSAYSFSLTHSLSFSPLSLLSLALFLLPLSLEGKAKILVNWDSMRDKAKASSKAKLFVLKQGSPTRVVHSISSQFRSILIDLN